MRKKYQLRKWHAFAINRLVALLMLMVFVIMGQNVKAQTATFYQLNFNYGGTLTPFSDWGAIDVTFVGSADLLYLNLSRDTAWAIENMPVQTIGNVGDLQTQRFWFPIGLNGIPVTLLQCGFTLTPLLSGRPVLQTPVPVAQEDIIIYTGALSDAPLEDNHPPPAKKQKGGAAVQPPQQHKGFPNQEAGVNECVPVGISNSLQFLNAKFGLGMKPADIGIPSLKNGTAWGPGGCPRPGWVQNKKNYVKNKKLPITTRKLSGPANIKNIGAEIAKGQDVEMDIKWKGGGAHCVCITGWVDLGNGKYKIIITHDSKQGQVGGTVSETATFDKATGKWDGALVNGTNDFFFVVECPTAKARSATQPTIPSGNGYREKSNSGTTYQNGLYEMKDFMMSNITPATPPPPLGQTQTFSHTCIFSFNFSSDSGETFLHYSGPMNFLLSVNHVLDSAGTEFYQTELMSMTLAGLPPQLMVRESTLFQSVGMTPIMPKQNEWVFDGFFDVFYNVSVDGGATWMDADNGSNLLEIITESAVLNQLTFNYNGTITPYSDWGAIDLTFLGSSVVQYLNLTIDTGYVIENMPVVSLQAEGLLQTQRFWFRIGPDGIPVTSVMYGYTLTPVIAGKPPLEALGFVNLDSIRIFSGSTGGAPGGINKPRPAVKQKGGPVVNQVFRHAGFPNQEAGVNECVPVGISNSLKFLNNMNGLGMKAADIGIPSLKNGTGWGPGGCPRPGWVNNKKNYVKAKKLPITTRKLAGPAGIKNIGAEIAAGQDVEMDIKWQGPGAHCVCVTSWVDLGNGKYKITITHDSKQGKAGGTVSESATYDSNTGTWTGALANGTNDFFFVVECPTTKVNQATPTVPPSGTSKYKPNSGSLYGGGLFQIQNLQMMNSNPVMPIPPVGGTEMFTYQCMISLDVSSDFGLTFIPFFSPAVVLERVTRLPDSLTKLIMETEIMSLQLINVLPYGLMLRENPTKVSLGYDVMMPIQGGQFMVESFFDVFTEISSNGGLSWMAEDESGSTLLEVDGPSIPEVREVQNVVAGDGQYECYDATQTLIIAGNGTTYSLESGANVTMIAGMNIMYMPGTYIHLGGYMEGYITTDGQYCYSEVPLVLEVSTAAEEKPVIIERSFFKVYPNPVADYFTIEFTGEPLMQKINVEIYSLMGGRVFSLTITGEHQHIVSLTGLPAGVYLVRVITGSKSETVKLIKL